VLSRTGSVQNHLISTRDEGSHKRSKKEEQDDSPPLQLVPPQETEDPAPQTKAPDPLNFQRQAALTVAMLELFEVIQTRRDRLLKWLGFSGYQSSARAQGRSKLFKKGAMLDRSA